MSLQRIPTFQDVKDWTDSKFTTLSEVNNNADVPNADHADTAGDADQVDGQDYTDIQNWVNNNADVPNADYADTAGDANTLDGNDSTAFASPGDVRSDEEVQDVVGALINGGTDVTVSYDDGANALTINSTASGFTEEEVEDIVGSLLTTGSNLTVNYDDANDTITVGLASDVSVDNLTVSNAITSGSVSTEEANIGSNLTFQSEELTSTFDLTDLFTPITSDADLDDALNSEFPGQTFFFGKNEFAKSRTFSERTSIIAPTLGFDGAHFSEPPIVFDDRCDINGGFFNFDGQIELNGNYAFVSNVHIGSPTEIVVDADSCVLTGVVNGSVTFTENSSDCVIDGSTGVDVTDDGSNNTIGDV